MERFEPCMDMLDFLNQHEITSSQATGLISDVSTSNNSWKKCCLFANFVDFSYFAVLYSSKKHYVDAPKAT